MNKKQAQERMYQLTERMDNCENEIFGLENEIEEIRQEMSRLFDCFPTISFRRLAKKQAPVQLDLPL